MISHVILCLLRLLASSVAAVWCRRTDELVDGPNASHITPGALDRWEERLEEAFQCRPYDMFDATLSHTIVQYPLSIQVSIVTSCLAHVVIPE